MFIQLNKFENTFGDTSTVFVNPSRIEYFYPIQDTYGGREITVTRITDRKSTRLNSSHIPLSRMPSSA